MTMKTLENKPLLKLTETQLLDYIKCPNLFYLKYLSRIPYKESKTYKDCIKNLMYAYLGRLLDGKVLTLKEIKNKWDRIIDENEELFNENKVLEGIGYMNILDHYCRTHQVIIADINTPYQVNFKDNIAVTGNLGPLRYNNGKIELFLPESSQKQPDQTLLNMSIKYTLQIKAIKQLDKSVKVDGIKIFHVKSGKEFTSYRTQKDFDRLDKIVSGVGKAIREEIFYAREDYMCSQCKYKNYCGYI